MIFFSNLDVNTEIHMDISKSLEEMNSSHGCFLKWWVFPQNIPKWSFLVGKPMVVGYPHFRTPPHFLSKSPILFYPVLCTQLPCAWARLPKGRCWNGNQQSSGDQNLAVNIGEYTLLPSYKGIYFIGHYKNPYEPISMMECQMCFWTLHFAILFEVHLREIEKRHQY